MPLKIEDKDFFIKDLDIIEDYPIEKILIIDNSVLSFAYHLSNGIPIVSYSEGMEDSELLVLAYYVVLSRYNEIGCYAIVLMMNIFYRQLFIVIANY